MRTVQIVLIGGLAAAAAFFVPVGGTLHDGAFMLGLFTIVLTVGLATAAVVEQFADRPVLNPVLVAQAAAQRCTECGTPRITSGSLLLCARCDRAPAR